MTRLTKKIENQYIIECPNLHNYIDEKTRLNEFLSTQNKGIQKLGQLEDILEKHNILTFEELEMCIENGEKTIDEFEKWWENRFCELVKPYKDIEEELGIDLITLFKILKSENIYANGKRYDNSNSLSYMGNSWLIFNHQAKQGFRFKDYGKTWALTKEEELK